MNFVVHKDDGNLPSCLTATTGLCPLPLEAWVDSSLPSVAETGLSSSMVFWPGYGRAWFVPWGVSYVAPPCSYLSSPLAFLGLALHPSSV